MTNESAIPLSPYQHDTCVVLATASVSTLLAWLKRHSADEPPAAARA